MFCLADALHTAATSLSANAALASTAIGTITSGSDGLVSNFASLQVSLTNIVSLADAFIGGFYCPVGMITPFGAATAPTGWLLCDGAAVSRSTYAVLFAIIASTYGAGDASTTFNTPNLKGRVPVGLGTGASQGLTGSGVSSGGTALTARTIGGFVGDERSQSHTHVQDAHRHSNLFSGSSQSDVNQVTAVFGAWQTGTYRNDTSSSETATNQTSGSGLAENVQPSLIVNYIIKF